MRLLLALAVAMVLCLGCGQGQPATAPELAEYEPELTTMAGLTCDEWLRKVDEYSADPERFFMDWPMRTAQQFENFPDYPLPPQYMGPDWTPDWTDMECDGINIWLSYWNVKAVVGPPPYPEWGEYIQCLLYDALYCYLQLMTCRLIEYYAWKYESWYHWDVPNVSEEEGTPPPPICIPFCGFGGY